VQKGRRRLIRSAMQVAVKNKTAERAG